MTVGPAQRPLAIVMGMSPTGLHVVRALGRAGVTVIGVADTHQAGGSSRYLSRSIIAGSADAKLAALMQLAGGGALAAAGRPVLIPTSDNDVDLIVKNAEALARHFNFQKSYGDGAAAEILAKDSFAKLCREHGIRHPQTWICQRSDVEAILREAALPCMVKPSLIHGIKHKMRGKKGWIVQSASQIESVLDDIPLEGGKFVVQEIVPGPESSISLACTHRNERGEQLQTFTARKLRQYPPGFGSASLVQSSPEPEAAELMARFLDATNYIGVAAAEFKRHPDTGALYIIEVNVRPSLWFALTQEAGRPVVLSLYQELGDTPLPEVGDKQMDGVRWHYWAKDAWSSFFYRRNPTYFLGKPETGAVGPARRHASAVFSLDDPLPGLAEIANFVRKAIVRLKSP
jgi:D-aspartate ligase